MSVIEIFLKWVHIRHLSPHWLLSKLDGAICLRIIVKTFLTPKRVVKGWKILKESNSKFPLWKYFIPESVASGAQGLESLNLMDSAPLGLGSMNRAFNE